MKKVRERMMGKSTAKHKKIAENMQKVCPQRQPPRMRGFPTYSCGVHAPYYENGTEISMEELDLVSPNCKGDGTEPIEQELASIESLCADESKDAGNEMRLFRMEDMGSYEAAGSDSGFEMEDGVLKGYAGSKKNIVIPDGTKEIGKEAFKENESLVSVRIPGSVTKIGKLAFFGCTSLTEIHYAGTKEQWKAVEKGDGWNKGIPAKDVLVRKE